MALEADHFSVLGGVGDRVPHTPKVILIIRDLFGGKMRFRSQSFDRANHSVIACSEIAANQAVKRETRKLGARDLGSFLLEELPLCKKGF